MQIPIVSGIYTDMQANYRVAYPRNLVPVPKQTGVSNGYLRVAEGMTQFVAPGAVGGATDRGGINWNGACYRVIGSKLCRVESTGSTTVLGDVGSDGKQVSLDYSFDYLIIGSNSNLFYFFASPAIIATKAVPATGGSGYAVGDTVLLSDSVSLTVSAVSSGAVTAATVSGGGVVTGTTPPPNPLGQIGTTGTGVGATFNLTWTSVTGVTQITTPALSTVVDSIWMAGYTVTTDGSFLVVTNLDNPLYVDPLKYGSSESDPDNITGVAKYRNELYAFNRYTIEVFDNVGGTGFPFQVQQGAIVEKGCLSRSLKCKIAQRMAFVGGARNEPLSVYLLLPGYAEKIATQEIEEILRGYTEAVLSTCTLEAREDRVHQHLYLHLPDQTLVYDIAASQVMEQPIWFVLSSTASTYGAYRARNFVWCYNKWLCGDLYDDRIGYLDRAVATQYGDTVGNQFDVPMLYNETKSILIQRLEVVGQMGLAPFGTNPTMSFSYTRDGKTWTQERFRKMGVQGAFAQRLLWLNAMFTRQTASLRFRAVTPALVTYTRIDADVQGLTV